MPNYTPTKNKAGELAYYDVFSGLVPCKVLRITEDQVVGGRSILSVQLTATRGAYKRGEVLSDLLPCDVVPRDKVRVRDGKYRIINSYEWVTES